MKKRRSTSLWLLPMSLLLLFVSFAPYRVVQGQASLESVKIILNRFWDRAQGKLQTTPVEAQGVLENEIVIWNSICIRDGAGKCIGLNIEGSGEGGGAIVANDLLDMNDVDYPPENNDVWTWDIALGLYVPKPLPAGLNSTGLRVSATEVETYRDKVTALSGNITLDLHNVIYWSKEGNNNATASLPDAADTAKPGKYTLIVADTGTGLAIVSPTASNTINGSSVAWPGITGKGSIYEAERESTTGWSLKQWSALPVGDLAGGLCRGVNGSTNVATVNPGVAQDHTLTCSIPARTFQEGSMIEACSIFVVITGSTAPTLSWALRLNDTYIDGPPISSPITLANNIARRAITFCTTIIAAAAPGSAVTLYSAPTAGSSTALNSATDTNWRDLQVVATDAVLLLKWSTLWPTAGAGTNANTVQQAAMFVKHVR